MIRILYEKKKSNFSALMVNQKMFTIESLSLFFSKINTS